MRALWLVSLLLVAGAVFARLPSTPIHTLVTKVRMQANTPVLAPSAVVATPGGKPIRNTVTGSFQVLVDPQGPEGAGNVGGACLFAQTATVHECKQQSDCARPALLQEIGSDEGFCVGRRVTDLGVVPGQCWFRPGAPLLVKGQAVCNKGKPLTPGFKGSMSAPAHAFGHEPHKWRVIACQSLKNMEHPQRKGEFVSACSLGWGGAAFSKYVFGDVLEVP
jgi:hypothetical protein